MNDVIPLYVERNKNEIQFIPMNERLKQLRLEKRFTMQQMADHLGIKRSTYAGYEANKTAQNHRYPKMELLILMAEKLETSSDYLLCLTNEKRPKTIPTDVTKLLNVDRLEYNGVIIDDDTKSFLKEVLARTMEAKRA